VAAGLAALGNHRVLATDLSAAAVAPLREGVPPVAEPGLADLLAAQLSAGSLTVLEPDDPRLGEADVVVLALDVDVGEDDAPLLESVERTAERIGTLQRRPVPLVVMSQVPVGTSERLAAAAGARAGAPLPVACVPENLRLGSALDGFFHPDRLVVGADDEGARAAAVGLFAGVDCPMVHMGVRSAEMSKHAMNAYLATCISFAGEMSDLCEVAGADAHDVVRALRSDARVSPRAPIAPGLGFAGGTLGRDLRHLARIGQDAAVPTPLTDAVREVNRSRIGMVSRRLARHLSDSGAASAGGMMGTVVALLGLTYKPGTDTLRRSQSLEVARVLTEAGAEVRGHDPAVGPARSGECGFPVAPDPYAAAAGADAVVVMTPWPAYRELDLGRLAAAMRRPLLFDPAGVVDARMASAAGLVHDVVGRPAPPLPGPATAGASGTPGGGPR
jgi:UDPglucose 6-dehydrogenase